MSLSQTKSLEQLRTLNEKFRASGCDYSKIREILVQEGCDLDLAVIFRIFPDSGSTWVVELMNQDGELMKYDLDVAANSCLEAEVIDRSSFGKRSGQIMMKSVAVLQEERANAS